MSTNTMNHFRISAFKLIAGILLLFLIGCPLAKQTVKVGYLSGMELNLDQGTIKPTLEFLQKQNPDYEFEIVQISPVDTISDLKKNELDFLIAPSTFFIELSDVLPVNHVATRKSLKAKNPSKSIGSTFIVRADNQKIDQLSDLKGKTCVASLPNSLGGYLAAMGEIHKQGFDPQNFFKKVTFTQYQTPDIFNAVLSGNADVGILSTCVLEQAIHEGLVEKDKIKVVGEKNTDSSSPLLACKHSTSELYPDLSFLTFDNTSDDVVRNIVISLLSMVPVDDYRWTLGNDYLSIRNLLRELKVGPYSYLRDFSFRGLAKRYKTELVLGALLLCIVFLDEIRLHWLVRRKTQQLTKALIQKEQADKIAREERKRLSILERNGVISQMGSILAHEAKQPIGTIVNYLEVLRMQLKGKEIYPVVEKVLSTIDSEVLRLNALIDTVRNYAKKKDNKKVLVDLNSIALAAIKTFERNEPDLWKMKVGFKTQVHEPMIKADPLALELLILNLIRNGTHAAIEGKNKEGIVPKVGIVIEDHKQNGKYKLTVWNSGVPMNEEDMKKLVSLGESVKPEGLGLGLSIIRDIADKHAATISFKSRLQGGIQAEVLIDKFSEPRSAIQ